MAECMQCRVSPFADGSLVAVSGEVDISTAASLAEALVQADHGAVVVDLTEVTFFDASGVRALIAARRHVERRGGRLMVKGTSQPVRRILHITGIEFSPYIDSNGNQREIPGNNGADHARQVHGGSASREEG